MPRRTKIVATLGPATDDPAALDGVLGLRWRVGQREWHELREAIEVRFGTGAVAGALKYFIEMIIEEEDPHVPIGDQLKLGAGCLGMGVGAEQGVVHRVKRSLIPDDGAGLGLLRRGQDAHGAGPGFGMRARLFQMGVQPGRIGHVKLW